MSADAPSSQNILDSADGLFKAGRFAEAEKLYIQVMGEDSNNALAASRLGQIALLANRLEDAQKWLTKASELRPEEAAAKSLLAEVFYRRDDFQHAAPLVRALGREAMAKELESFKDDPPYQIEGKADVTSLKFIMTDPLPVVQVRVNASDPVNFFIDTGGAEVIIDAEFAKEVAAAQFGPAMGTFAGGKQAGFQHGRVDSLILGDFAVKNVPVHIMDVRRFSQPIFGGKRVDGIIGTVLLYHFLATLDYPRGELILRRKTEESLKQMEQEAQSKNSIIVPFWMAGDHYMVAWGTVNKSQPLLFFVDTGLAGGGFTCPESTLKEAGISLQESLSGEGIGGGGKVKVTPFVVQELALGEAKELNVQGLYTGPFPLENAFGFRIGGLISHGFFRSYAFTLDFAGMRYFLTRKE
jgi:predicted aspartyl protease